MPADNPSEQVSAGDAGLTDLAESILAYGEICDHCLGRFFGMLSFGLSNADRGYAIRVVHGLVRNEPYRRSEGRCWVCGNLFDGIDAWAERVVESLTGIEFATFLIGTRVPPLIAENEEMVWSDLHLTDAEPLKAELNREVGKAVGVLTGKDVDFRHPDIIAILDLAECRVEVQIQSVFFYGKYRKMERGIPQTHWDCRTCRGAGCERCNFTGKQYQDSVEELIGGEAIRLFDAAGAVLHGAGREDIDARMMGAGRPFIMEMTAPRRRTLDLRYLEERINSDAEGRVSVTLERWTGRDAVEIIKSNKAHKKYRILVEVDGSYSADEFRFALKSLEGATIYQRTPQRVVHRRSDKCRERRVLMAEFAGTEEDRFVVEVTGEAGLYIKELISGDNGRTTPSLAEILGSSARVTSLDVMQVEDITEEDSHGTSQRTTKENTI
jgi:tRNA pseudouridine synthase 10